MITVIDGGGMGYAATSDLTPAGLRRAAEEATGWARRSGRRSVVDFGRLPLEPQNGEFATPVAKPWGSIGLKEKLEILQRECERLKSDDRIVDWSAALIMSERDSLQITMDGGRIFQRRNVLIPQ
ncbi:MAG: TldD/PmbA family protein, partial [Candidatus Latescibacteria bacterium]|nr:TldD/PmbA family protein [Candidatus Latescibacterota bacterium]